MNSALLSSFIPKSQYDDFNNNHYQLEGIAGSKAGTD